jgi:hypothetical protein
LAILCSGLAVIASLFVVGSLFTEIANLYDDAMGDMEEFKVSHIISCIYENY